jgi:hypothetical protein
MNPMRLLELISTLIVVFPATTLTKAPEVIGATIQAIAAILAALLTVLIPLFVQERNKAGELERLLDEQKKFISENKEKFQELVKAVANPELKNALSKTLNSFNIQLIEIGKAPGVWKNAYIWLKREQNNLLKNALNDVIKKYPDLKKTGGSLASKEQINTFKMSIEDRLDWIRISLKNTTTIPIELIKDKWTPLITEPTAYLEAYNSMKRQIRVNIENGRSSLSRDGAEVMQNFIDCLVNERIF